jgi:hypothetical protein
MNFLVKGSSPTVYYNSSTGKRYFFPNDSVFKSWYPNYSAVAQVSDDQLATLPLAGNVTYKPGSVMVKITTDPKVYAVSRYGVLRWIATEDVATRLYGANWNTKVVDVPDTYFTNYLIGSPINSTADYSPSQELAAVTSPDDNLRPATGYLPPGTTTSTNPTANSPQIVLNSTASHAVLNQSVIVNATVSGSNQPIAKIEIHSNLASGPVQVCINTTTCAYSLTVQTAPLHAIYTADVYDNTGTKFTTPADSEATLDVAAVSNQIQMSASPQTVTLGGRASFTSTVTNPPAIESHKIYALIPGQPLPVLWKDCGTTALCAASTPFYRSTYLYSQITSGGQTLVSPEVLVMVTGGEPPHPTLTISGHPQPNQVQIDLTAPYGETIGFTTIVDGTNLTDPTLALCNTATCSFVLQINLPGNVTAFTNVGGKEEPSNVIAVTPQ